MKRNKKWMVAVALLLLVSMFAAACGGNNNNSGGNSGTGNGGSSDNSGSAETVELDMWVRWPEHQQLFEDVVADFMAEYPNIKINLTESPPSQYVATVQTAISGGNLPDIFGSHPSLPVYQLVQLDLLHPLTDFLQDRMDEFEEGIWTNGYTMMDGEIYALPIMTGKKDGFIMYYNKNILEKAGLTEDQVPKTWDELLAVSKTIQEKTDAYGVLFGLNGTWVVADVAMAMKSTISPEVLPMDSFDPVKGEYRYDTQGAVEVVEFFKKMVDEGIVHPNSLVMTPEEVVNLFASDQAAFLFDGAWNAGTLLESGFENFSAAHLPTKDGSKPYFEYSGSLKAGLHVNKNTKHYEEVKIFLNYLIENYFPAVVERGLSYSPMPSVNESVTPKDPQRATALKLQDEMFIPTPHPFKKNTNAIKVYEAMSGKEPDQNVDLGTIIEGYLSGQIKDVAGILKQMSEEHQELLLKTIADVQAQGYDVDINDWIAEDWKPYVPYTVE
jgi:ABC-type glycerol-3-phosphate transport system substrate-binding protein